MLLLWLLLGLLLAALAISFGAYRFAYHSPNR